MIDKKLILNRLYDNVKTHVTRDEFCEFFTSKSRNLKLGIDPTFTEIHLGHAVTLERLRILQDLGHKVFIIIGSFTALIGDPSGKTATRPMLTKDQIKINMKTYKTQLNKILLSEHTTYCFNDEWLDKKLSWWLPYLHSITVSQLLQREDIKNRLKDQKPVSLAELMYPIMQGTDSVFVESDAEFGGSDQWFNIMFGRQMQSIMNASHKQISIVSPLIMGTNGQKMSKTSKNYITLSDSNMFGKIMSMSDNIICDLVKNLIMSPEGDNMLLTLANNTGQEAVYAKAKIAEYLVSKYQGEGSMKLQKESFYKPQVNAPKWPLDKPQKILDIITNVCPQYSSSHIKRLVKQGSVYIDSIRINCHQIIINPSTESNRHLKIGKYNVILLKNE